MLAVSSSHLPGLEVVAAAFAPLGHELVIYLGQQTEFRKRPLYISTMQGVRVLEVLPKSAALRAGIKTGDIIYSVNGRTVNNKADLETASCSGGILEFEFIMKLNNRWKRVPVKLKPGEGLGIIAVPEGNESVYTELGNTNYITKMIRKIRTIFSIEN